MRRRLLLGLVTLALLWVTPVRLRAATYTVGSGQTYATIGQCLTVAQPGDTCDVYTGDYTSAGIITSVRSGTSNTARITVKVHTGETATVRRFAISHDYITISGFTVLGNATSTWALSASGADYLTLENNTFEQRYYDCVQLSGGTYAILRNNVMRYCGWNLSGTSSGTGVQLYGSISYVLLDGNEIHHTTDDCFKLDGSYAVFRNNYCHDSTPETPQGYNTAHIDFLHGSTPQMTHILLEGNIYKNVTDSTGNCHWTWIEGTAGHTRMIFRYNYINNIGGTATLGFPPYDIGANNWYSYNNTHTGGANEYDGFCFAGLSWFNYFHYKNTICYALRSGSSVYPHYTDTNATQAFDGNLVYEPGYTPSWQGRYTTESTYAYLSNVNPQFTNYPTAADIGASSPARDRGVALTTVAAADTGSGTSLVVVQSGYFWDGEGLVDADQIRIGASTYATISSINYATNTITLTASVSRNDGDPVYLYRKSDGDIVLVGTLPDVGAYEYGLSGTAPSAPTNVRIR